MKNYLLHSAIGISECERNAIARLINQSGQGQIADSQSACHGEARAYPAAQEQEELPQENGLFFTGRYEDPKAQTVNLLPAVFLRHLSF
jgi:hypothetical protein